MSLLILCPVSGLPITNRKQMGAVKGQRCSEKELNRIRQDTKEGVIFFHLTWSGKVSYKVFPLNSLNDG